MASNRLSEETSPYLQQHKDNPVHWWPWCQEAFAEAQRLDKPVLLSIGYAACHWCHVMAHESFEKDDTAALMNQLFVNIKVDREERPDVDTLYMTALQELGEQGGWPLTMFLLPDGMPFFGGTYFPPEPRYGRPSFKQVLENVARVYANEKETIKQNTAYLKSRLTPRLNYGAAPEFSEEQLAAIASKFIGAIDPANGGLRGAPKFPNTTIFHFLWKAGLRYGLITCIEEVKNTLLHICQGGIYDHIGGGFSRYSVDERWLVPHFEKMLYDNALLIELMTEVWKETQSDRLKARVAETIGWIERDMIVPGGGFAASYDADSEGEEGKFYVWTAAEITGLLGNGEQAAVFSQIYDVTEGGNWEGKTILNRLNALALLNRAGGAGSRRVPAEALRGARKAQEARLGRQGSGRLERPGHPRDRQGGRRLPPAGMDRAGGQSLRLRSKQDVRERPLVPFLPAGQAQGARDLGRLRQHDFGGLGPSPDHRRNSTISTTPSPGPHS